MKKLFLICPGGSGIRFLKSFVMLMSAGLKLKEVHEVVPVVLDLDSQNGNLQDGLECLNLYYEISKQAYGYDLTQDIEVVKPRLEDDEHGFFHMPVRKAFEKGFVFSLVDLKGKSELKLKDFIGYSPTNFDAISKMSTFCYGRDFLDKNLRNGFYGHPSIAPVVFTLMKKSEDYNRLRLLIQDEDLIFFASSTFGGTGASAFPFLTNLFKQDSRIQNCYKGSISFDPYFNLDDQDQINYELFASKANVSKKYYGLNRDQGYLVNPEVMYFIGEPTPRRQESYAVGAVQQKNQAHFLELIGALSAYDFVKKAAQDNPPVGKKITYAYENKENSKQDYSPIRFNDLLDLRDELSKDAAYSLTYLKYVDGFINSSKSSGNWLNNLSIRNHTSFFTSDYDVSPLSKFLKYFNSWLFQLQLLPTFQPFEIGEEKGGRYLLEAKNRVIYGFEEKSKKINHTHPLSSSYDGLLSKLSKTFNKSLEGIHNNGQVSDLGKVLLATYVVSHQYLRDELSIFDN